MGWSRGSLGTLSGGLGHLEEILRWSWAVLGRLGRSGGGLGRSGGGLGSLGAVLGVLWAVQNRSENRSENPLRNQCPFEPLFGVILGPIFIPKSENRRTKNSGLA